ncbi:protein translocase subunit SecF [Candidatus Berkelbacteria bacterium]|nr:protein translocase subunit SecF [Candidatus Berkelbacteria bacterium]
MYKRKTWWFVLSGLTVVIGVISLILYDIPFGLDFKGGANLEVKVATGEKKTIEEAVKGVLERATVVETGKSTFLIKSESYDQKKKEKILSKTGGQEVRFENVGPTVSKDLTRKAIRAVVAAAAGISLYIAWAFRKVAKPASSWRFGISAIAAMLHDLFIVIGLYSLVAHFTGYEFDSLTVTALLTVMGFSVHDTIVVFDRIRENLLLHPGESFESLVDRSVVQTLARSLNTSLTVILALLTLYLLGGETTRGFVFALLVGITVGTYSSIFVASPLLVVWQDWVAKRSSNR